jgi:hypothetical protein
VKPNEVHSAIESFEELGKFLAVEWGVVYSSEENVFEGDASLVTPIVFLEQGYYVGYGKLFLSRHELQALLVDRGVKAHGKVTLALIEVTAKVFLQSHR